MSVAKYEETSFHNVADNNVYIDSTYDGVVMLSHDFQLFGDAEVRPDGRKIFHIFERAPDGEQVYDDYPATIPQNEKEALWLKTFETSFKNIQEIMLKNGVLLDEWCPPLSESSQNSRNNKAQPIKRKKKTSLKKFRKQAGERVSIKTSNEEIVAKGGLSRLLRNKNGKENGNSDSSEAKSSNTVSFVTNIKRERKPKEEEKPFCCPKCPYSSLYKSNVVKHTLRFCKNKDKNVSKSRIDFKNSEILPAKDRYYLCDMCNFSTRYKSNLKQHKLTHLKDKKFTCPFCGFGSNVLNRIEDHIYRKHKDKEEKEELRVEKLNYSCKSNKKNLSIFERNIPNCDSAKSITDTNEVEAQKNVITGYLANKCSPTNNASSLNLVNVNTNCSVVLTKCSDSQLEKAHVYLNRNKIFSSGIDYERGIKKEIEEDLEDVEDRLRTGISSENQYQIRNGEHLDTKVSQSPLDPVIKKESQSDEDCDDTSSSEIPTKNRHQNMKSEFLDEKQVHLSLDVLGMETITNEPFNQNVKQESELSIFDINSVSPIKKRKNFKIKSESFSDDENDDDDKIKINHKKRSKVNRSPVDKREGSYEVIKGTRNGSSISIFKSTECPYTSVFKFKIIQHWRTHKKGKIYNCLDCKFTAKCLFLLKLHKKTHVENCFKCQVCPFSTTSALTLKAHRFSKHRMRHQSNSSYTASKLRKRSTVSEASYNCNMCIFKTRDIESYEDHIKIHLESMTKREERMARRPLSTVNTHKISKENKTPIRKPNKQICETKTVISRKIAKKKYKCEKCSFVTDKVKNLSKHKQTHVKSIVKNKIYVKDPPKNKPKNKQSNVKSSEKNKISLRNPSEKISSHKQSDVKSSGKNKISLRNPPEEISKHKQSDVKSFGKNKISLRNPPEKISRHKQTHIKSEKKKVSVKNPSENKLENSENNLPETLLSCSHCSFTTSLNIMFLKHKQSHLTTSGVFKCTECSFSASKNKVLISHLMTHAYKYLYRCIHCNFSCKNKSILKTHNFSHKKPREKTNIRMFRNNKMTVSLQAKNNQKLKCFKCDYSCSSEHLLNQHALAHLENKLLKCAHCDFETNYRGNLVKHVLIHVDEYFEDP